MSPKDRFGVNLQRLRTAAGLSQMELGNRCGMHFTTISRLERAQRDPQLETMATVAAGLGVPLADLVAGIPASESAGLSEARGSRAGSPSPRR